MSDFSNYRIGTDHPLLLIAGPCVLQDRSLAFQIAKELVTIGERFGLQVVFKASFDKANRTNVASERGPGLEDGMKLLSAVRSEFSIPVTTDIHLPSQAKPVADVCDLIQIPAFLSRQTDLLAAAAQTGKAVNVKKGQFMAPADMQHVVGKLTAFGCLTPLICERGTFFGYGRLVSDMTGLVTMREYAPVVFDATHSVQLPSNSGGVTGGRREMVAPLARAAMAVGVSGLFVETHPHPESSPSDGPNMVPLADLSGFVQSMLKIRTAAQEIKA